METTVKKTLRLSERAVEKMEQRDRTIYKYESQYMDAAVLAFSGNDAPDISEVKLLEKRIENLEERMRQLDEKGDNFQLPHLTEL